MKHKLLSVTVLTLMTILIACSSTQVYRSAGEHPKTTIEAIPGSGYQLVEVDQVEVTVGVGSPIPVEVVVSGAWPDLCAQIAEVRNRMDGFKIDITVLASTVDPCPPDHLGLPFRFAIPLNIVEMQAGTYTIAVNGRSTIFTLPVKP